MSVTFDTIVVVVAAHVALAYIGTAIVIVVVVGVVVVIGGHLVGLYLKKLSFTTFQVGV